MVATFDTCVQKIEAFTEGNFLDIEGRKCKYGHFEIAMLLWKRQE